MTSHNTVIMVATYRPKFCEKWELLLLRTEEAEKDYADLFEGVGFGAVFG